MFLEGKINEGRWGPKLMMLGAPKIIMI
jgi:hypothetical protein